ncbi:MULTISPECIES: energy-coupling factor ABC transporter ATP-binding protein [unclassified Coleofasciculus]|uniref:energy-coupling factor ABC transporter ATP-binding protein n=1 Tax=unclassified Coleofasciculus TaxID=2692782 RepID=UPI001882C562|nr:MULTISPECIES: ABC transporter ATP-binding protein [unclassified Coleofasciculus]MBE9128908.1 ABC transporter ATP-binding protein [Coleofasciculus sp. LEGE 07081]MBE9151646.1 ABC transporter ATP-binding protein [Coleofasciculus sp. LEGE 07092]
MTQLTKEFNQKKIEEAALSISGLTFAYPKQGEILKNLNLRIHSGERVGLIGANGSGKTTLFLLVCGILTPISGKIQLFDKPVETGAFRSEMGLVFQNPDDQLFTTSVRDDVAFGPENMNLDAEEVENRVRKALSVTGVEELIDRVPQNLSGGEKCMVAIASVLAMQPQIILYDEPTANLDLRARRRLIRFLQNSQETYIISTHDLEMILEVCDRVLLLDEGQIIADGNPREVMGDKQLMEAHGLEKPHSLTPHR